VGLDEVSLFQGFLPVFAMPGVQGKGTGGVNLDQPCARVTLNTCKIFAKTATFAWYNKYLLAHNFSERIWINGLYISQKQRCIGRSSRAQSVAANAGKSGALARTSLEYIRQRAGG
jgi:hypothetical protein